jgi:hypothetical protein
MDTQILIISILGLVIVFLIILLVRFDRKFQKLFAGTSAKDLEGVIHIVHKHVEGLKNNQESTNKEIELINKRLAKSVRSIETLRFNPFPDAGGNQSFAISLINDEGDGVVISSLYARDRMSIFAKPIEKGNPVHELTVEEDEVLNKSKNKNGKK